MTIVRRIGLCWLLLVCSLVLVGCGEKAGKGASVDENKPVSEVQAEAEKMDISQLKQIAMKYRDAIVAKKGDIEKITTDLKKIPIAEALGEEAKKLKWRRNKTERQGGFCSQAEGRSDGATEGWNAETLREQSDVGALTMGRREVGG